MMTGGDDDDSSSSMSILMRGGSLFVLIVLFQVFIAHAPSTNTTSNTSTTTAAAATHQTNKSPSETQRRFQHALTGHAMVQLSYIIPRSICIVLLLLAALGMYILRTWYTPLFMKAFGPLLRPNERQHNRLPGAFYFLVGTGLTVWFFSTPSEVNTNKGTSSSTMIIPRYAVECLAIADPVASWIGTTIKSPKVTKSSSVAGCIACFVSSWVVGWIMLRHNSHSDVDNNSMGGSTTTTTSTSFVITCGALACTIAEGLLPCGNDNLTIPLLTAATVDFVSHGFQNSLFVQQLLQSLSLS